MQARLGAAQRLYAEPCAIALCALNVLLLATGCGGGDEASSHQEPPAATGGTDMGGMGGTESGTGGNGTGGKATGGGSTGGESTGGASTGGMGGGSGDCEDGDTRPGDAACGLNDRGTLQEVCEDGAWSDASTCDDPDECIDEQERNTTTACGTNGVLVEECDEGQWSVTTTCKETPECSGSTTQPGTTSCGLNGRGKLDQECQGGFWQDTTTCADPDVCEDDDDRTLTNVCGLNDRGDVAQTCEEGAWVGNACADPDECTDGDTQESASCLGGSGTLQQKCEDGSWSASECVLGAIVRVSVSNAPMQANHYSEAGSTDGRVVVFRSVASNLVANDTNGVTDIFLRDLATEVTTRLSLSSQGTQSNGDSHDPRISADGRFVAFSSQATNLVSGDTNNADDVFVRDLETNVTTRVSVSSSGAQGNKDSFYAAISANGRYVAFMSTASTLVPGDTNAAHDIFVHDLVTATTSRVSVNSAGVEGNTWSPRRPSISGDGRYVAFDSGATNLMSGDTNATDDVFVRDRDYATTTCVSMGVAGASSNGASVEPSISADGRYVAFQSSASNLVLGDTNGVEDVFVHDRQAGTTVRVSVDSSGNQGTGASSSASISSDGRYVAFTSEAPDLVSGDTNSTADVFVRDLVTGTTVRVSSSATGVQGDGYSIRPSLSPGGDYVAFQSFASTLVAGDTNGFEDIFLAPLTWTP